MNNNLKIGSVVLVLSLLIINVVLFSQTIVIGDNIAKLEQDIHQVKINNMELEQKLYTVNSLENLAKIAPSLGFTKDAQPTSLDNFTVALAK